MTIYLSGPMTGIAEWNYPAFHAAAARLRAEGYTVLNPAENFGGDTTRPRADYMRRDVEMVLRANAVIVLPGGKNSRGAMLEVAIAEEIGIPVIELDKFKAFAA